jgi:hypothetical protein
MSTAAIYLLAGDGGRLSNLNSGAAKADQSAKKEA